MVFSNRIGLFWFRFPPVLFARGYWFCGSSMGWGLRPRGYSGTRRYVRECRLYAVEGFTGTNSLYGFRMGEGGFGAPPVGDVTHGIFLGLTGEFSYAFTVPRDTIHIWVQLPRGNPRKFLAGKNVTRIGVPKKYFKAKNIYFSNILVYCIF